MKKDNINVICYTGMIICFILIILPPLSRWILGSETVINTPEVESFVCTKTETIDDTHSFTIKVKNIYLDKSLQSVTFTYDYPNDIDLELLSDNNYYKEMKVFQELTNIYGNTIIFDFSINKYDSSALSKYIGKYDSQIYINKNYGFNCSGE